MSETELQFSAYVGEHLEDTVTASVRENLSAALEPHAAPDGDGYLLTEAQIDAVLEVLKEEPATEHERRVIHLIEVARRSVGRREEVTATGEVLTLVIRQAGLHQAAPTSPHLRLRGLSFIDDDVLTLSFDGVGTEDQEFTVRRSVTGGISVLNFDDPFNERYLGVPCLSLGHPFFRLAHLAWSARDNRLPTGEAWRRAYDTCVAEVEMRGAKNDSSADRRQR